MATEDGIADVTASCLSRFNDCLDVKHLMADEWAENRLADFNIWIYSMGATARGKASLDSRLATRPGTQRIIFELLHLLNGLIRQCRDFDRDAETLDSASNNGDDGDLLEGDQPLEQPLPRAFSPWSDASQIDEQSSSGSIVPDNPLLGKMKHIETILGQLARISVAIRHSGNSSRFQEGYQGLQKADQWLDPDEHHIFRDTLIAILLRRPGHTTELTSVQKRLIDANIRRRNRFLYAQAHAVQPSMAFDDCYLRNSVSQITEDVEEAMVESDPECSVQEEPRTDPPTPSGVGTTTTSRFISESIVLDKTEFPVPEASTSRPPAVVELEYPSPPVIKEDAQAFTCPYCWEALPIEFAEKDRWK